MTAKRVIIFISGSGSNMAALMQAATSPLYPAEIIAVISDQDNALGLSKAQAHGVPTHCVRRKDYASKQDHEEAILDILQNYQPDIICLAGYMRLLSKHIIAPYQGRILNIHPSLLPMFPGLNTHERALKAGVKIVGCTVHLVTEGMDEGPIIAQGAVPVLPNDNAEILAKRVLAVEHQLYVKALKSFIENQTNSNLDWTPLINY